MWVWFAMFFGGSFGPGLCGKVFASLAGIVLSLYLLSLMRGNRRYVFAVALPVLSCIFIRFFSGSVYGWIVDIEARGVMLGRVNAMVDCVVHYCERIGQTAYSLWGVVEFFQTWELGSLSPILENSQFVVVVFGMVLCPIMMIFRKTA
jgi:hypothetical protein